MVARTLTVPFLFFILLSPSNLLFSQARSAEAYFREGLAADNAQDYDNAAALYTKAIRADGSLISAAINLAIIYGRWQKLDTAQNLYDQVLQIAPHSFEAYYNRARLFLERGDLKLAQKDYLAALELRPEEPSLFVNLAGLEIHLYEKTHSVRYLESAEKKLRKAEGLKYHSPALYFNRARLMEFKNAPARARTLYTEAMRYFDSDSIEYKTCLVRAERLSRQLR